MHDREEPFDPELHRRLMDKSCQDSLSLSLSVIFGLLPKNIFLKLHSSQCFPYEWTRAALVQVPPRNRPQASLEFYFHVYARQCRRNTCARCPPLTECCWGWCNKIVSQLESVWLAGGAEQKTKVWSKSIGTTITVPLPIIVCLSTESVFLRNHSPPTLLQ